MCDDPQTLWAFLHQHPQWCVVWTILVLLTVLVLAGSRKPSQQPKPPEE